LNTPLPATSGTFQGTIIIDVRPKMQLPEVSPGVRLTPADVRCFFYETVPAQSCTWTDPADGNYPDYTRITITTPTTDPYYQTEIPITITS